MLCLLWAALACAQQQQLPESQQLSPEKQQLSLEQTGGVYYAYPVTEAEKAVFPDGFAVFYISHYGRHGSRWLPDEARYEWVNQQFDDVENLTPLGLDVRKRLKKIWNNARGNAGQLTALGARQHRQIARRMAHHYPEVFADNPTIVARSSTVPRCRASMLSFCRALPCKDINPETDAAFMAYINYESPELKALSARTRGQVNISPERFMQSLFKDPSKHQVDALKLLSELHTIASDMQDIPLKVSLWDVFTPEEMMAVHAANTKRMTMINGFTPLNDGIPARSSIPLWRDIEQRADAMIAAGGHGAALRFGHDTALFRLLTLLQLSLPGQGMEQVLPMAANLQIIFARNDGGEVLVQFLHNERLQQLPIPSVNGCYRWNDVKTYMQQRIHTLEHVQQLASLNTMVGTAPANTRTAGLFGKGSEEHGQTLPAVLVPNGQTFWTPQTRDTEKKCVAPYYYTDSLFQGFRASHWLVGGCTQDYGSFSLAALGGSLRLTAAERATPFSHADEVSHPYYYAVNLRQEHLTAEMTGASHAAVLRVTPHKDQMVHIVLQVNSDEGQGTIDIDTLHHMIYMQNPVHRIYQGWGQWAGFSGHMVLRYTDEMVGFHAFEQGVALTFQGHKGIPLCFQMATSFTSCDGALRNLEAEAASFEQMMQANIDKWTTRLHTIDVEDADTARVNQFYGALYRMSFLPRLMSDVDGKYPRFAGNAGISQTAQMRYCDFSMWDTYRAVHPLLNIIAPKMSADMMQSLVGMYEEGGWLPIFPCWNSYTAAMIGDHCSSVLVDAYIKGIRNFDAATAYEAMRKNAMESPASPDAYKNGMGRRALSSYMKYGFIPLEDPVADAYHTQEQTSRTLEYAYDDFCVAQMARALGHEADYEVLMQRSGNWRNVINPQSGYADGRHADGRWENNRDLVSRQPYITEGATCHYTWYVPHDVEGLIDYLGGAEAFTQKLDSMFLPMQAASKAERTSVRYWHGNEPCHQVAWLYSLAGKPELTVQHVRHILDTEYNDTPGGLSGNDDAGQMSAWQVFASMGFYPVCPGTDRYVLGAPVFRRITINGEGQPPFVIEACEGKAGRYELNGQLLSRPWLTHEELMRGGVLTAGEPPAPCSVPTAGYRHHRPDQEGQQQSDAVLVP